MRLLDLFCGAGGAAKGYMDAGFHVTGVDIVDQPNYCGDEFIQADALAHPSYFGEFDLVHASPPCQAYTTMSNGHGRSDYAVIPLMRALLSGPIDGVPYVIENVAGAKSELRNPVELTGEMFGLGVYRPRLFELGGWMCLAPYRPLRQLEPAAVYGKQDGRRLWTRADGSELRVSNLEKASKAMGIGWMTWDEIREAIPPAYTKFIGEQFLLQQRVVT